MQIIPVNKQIILKTTKIEEKKVGGIIIPASIQEKPHQAIVYLSDHEDYKTGEVVLYRKYSGFEFKIDKDEFLVIESGDVLVKLVQTEEEAANTELTLKKS